ncbi:MAG: DUF2235 domain-containing protein [Pseudomonadota bacterium]
MKRIVMCCDGTWNELDYRTRPTTNVVKLAQSVLPRGSDGVPQAVFYDEGVGTLEGESLDGGAFGDGLNQNILDAYMHLVLNYDPGDQLYIFGFSRGAYTARSLVGLIRSIGVIRRDAAPHAAEGFDIYKSRTIKADGDPAVEFRRAYGYPGWWVDEEAENEIATAHERQRLQVEYLGVWDTVGQVGVPNVVRALANRNERHGFHDVKLTSMVKRARHAVAIDEDRDAFRPSLWQRKKLEHLRETAATDPERGYSRNAYLQLWFPGDHGSVGGGGDATGLSDHALAWVAEGARLHGAKLDYDPDFKGVNFPVNIRARRRGEKKQKMVRFAPSLEAPLSNVTDGWKRANSGLMGRLMGYAMSLQRTDRLDAFDDLDELSPQAFSYAGFNGKNTDYQERLRKRLKDRRRIADDEVKAFFDAR